MLFSYLCNKKRHKQSASCGDTCGKYEWHILLNHKHKGRE